MGVGRAATGLAVGAAKRTFWWSFWRAVRLVLATVGGCLFGWWWDRPGLVKDKAIERPLERNAQWLSAAFWPAVAMWLAVGAPNAPSLLLSLAGFAHLSAVSMTIWTVSVTVFAALVMMRRAMATRGRGWNLVPLLRAVKRWTFHYRLISMASALPVVYLPVYWLTGDRGEQAVGHTIPVIGVLLAGLLIAVREAAWMKRVESLRPRLAQVHKVSEAIVETAVLMPRRGGRGMVMPVVPPAVVTALDGLDVRLATHLPEFEAVVHRNDAGAVTSIEYKPTGKETASLREVRERTGGLVVSLTPVENPPPHRPDEHVAALADVSDSKAARVDRDLQGAYGFSVVDWPEQATTVSVARLDPVTRDLRDRIAAYRKCKPHQVEIALDFSQEGVVVGIDIPRAPVIPDVTKRKSEQVDMMRSLLPPPEKHDWIFEDRSAEDRARLDLRIDPLNVTIPWDADPTERITPSTPWRLGVDEKGDWIDIRLDTMAHGLIAGATRSGKSVATYSLITHVLRMGPSARLLIADPNDTTVAPFEGKVSWSTSSTHPEDVTSMLEWVRGEMDRRKPLMREMRTDAIREFSEDLPLIVVIIDEAANYMKHADTKARDAMKAELLAVVSQGAKYGIRLILITQRPDSTILDTATRAQLSFRISFRLEDKETASMAFPDFEDSTVLLQCAPGAGWMREVGEAPRRFRSVYLSDHWAVADALPGGQPRIQIVGSGQPIPAPAPSPFLRSTPVQEDVIEDLGEIGLSLDDLDLDDLAIDDGTENVDFATKPVVATELPTPVLVPDAEIEWD